MYLPEQCEPHSPVELDGTPIPKVIDFGIARATDQWAVENTLLTQFGQMVGTPEYASPEQAEVITGAVDESSDSWDRTDSRLFVPGARKK